jgi:hypothetical protein
MMGSNYGTVDSQIQHSSGGSIVTLPWIRQALTSKSGVTAQVFIVGKGTFKEIGKLSHSVVGEKREKREKCEKRKSNHQNKYHGINSRLNQFLSEGRRSLPGKDKPHAEAIWIATESNYNELIKASRDQGGSTLSNNIVEGVSAILEDHIAVYTSSSLCGDCSVLFEDFYQHLRQKENIKLPILFFAKKGTNNGDRAYGVWTIENGVYTSLPLSWSEEGRIYRIESLSDSLLTGPTNNNENRTLVTPGTLGGYAISDQENHTTVSNQYVSHLPHNVTSTESTHSTSVSRFSVFNQNSTTAVDRNQQESWDTVGAITNTSSMQL